METPRTHRRSAALIVAFALLFGSFASALHVEAVQRVFPENRAERPPSRVLVNRNRPTRRAIRQSATYFAPAKIARYQNYFERLREYQEDQAERSRTRRSRRAVRETARIWRPNEDHRRREIVFPEPRVHRNIHDVTPVHPRIRRLPEGQTFRPKSLEETGHPCAVLSHTRRARCLFKYQWGNIPSS